MDPDDLTEHQLDSAAVYDGALLHVKRDSVRLPDGKTGVREYIVHPGAVAILALMDDGQLLLERQYRYPVGRVLIEIPAGKIDAGEDTANTAKRELLEETGYVASEWRCLSIVHPLCAYSDEEIEIWLARGLSYQGRKLDEGEYLQVFTASLEETLGWVRDGTISDMKTIIAVHWAEKILTGGWAP